MTVPLLIRIFLEVLLVLCVWGYFGSQKILYPPRQELDIVPRDEGLDAEAFSVVTPDDVRLAGWLIYPETPKGVIVGCHGYGASKADLLSVTRFIPEAGYALVLFDFRRHGESGGRQSTLGARETIDLEAVLSWVRQEARIKKLPLGLLGFSMGASVALRVAADHSEVRGVISDNTFVNLRKTVRHHHKSMYPFLPAAGLADAVIRMTELRTGSRFRDSNPGPAVSRLKAPVFFIHSAGDETIREEDVRTLFKSAPEPKALWVADTADHMGASAFQERYESDILGFLNEHVGQSFSG